MSYRPYQQIQRRKSRQISVGRVKVGGDAPITVQTMTNTLTTDVAGTVAQIRRAEKAGVDIVRVSCPDQESALALKEIVRQVDVPIVADIHFHYSRAIEAAESGAACLRINPGNIGSAERVREVVKAARDHGCSMRIGVNAGSLERHLLEKYGEPNPEALVESALEHAKILQDHDFHEFKISVKASRRVPGGRRLSAARRSLRPSAAYRHHRGGRQAHRHGEILDRPRLAALGRHRRHAARLAVGRARGRGACRLGHAEVARHPPSRREDHLLPVLRAAGLQRHRDGGGSWRSGWPISRRRSRSRIIGCVVNGPGEALMTDLGVTGGGNGRHMVYAAGKQTIRSTARCMVDHIVELVEAKAAAIRAAEPAAIAAE